MKTLIVILTVVAGMAATAFGVVYMVFKPKPVEPIHNRSIEIIEDHSDTFLLTPAWGEILKGFKLEKNLWAGVDLRYSGISDVAMSKEYSVLLHPGNPAETTPYVRKKEIELFRADFDSLQAETEKIIKGRESSTVAVPIGKSLDRLSKSPAEIRECFIFSDLQENCKEFSTVSKRKGVNYVTDPVEIRKYILKSIPVSDLQNIAVLVFYEPRDTAEDRRFLRIAEIYKDILEEKGASFEISGEKKFINSKTSLP